MTLKNTRCPIFQGNWLW